MLGKSHDTFFPMGPYVVPRQFVPNPQKLPIKFSLSGKVMQDSNTDRMTHNVYELVEYASHLMTLQAGRPDLVGQPGRRRHGARHADLFQGRRHLDVHDREHRHAREPGPRGEVRPQKAQKAQIESAMPSTTRLFGLILIVLGVASYVLTGRTSVTALIPAFFGAVLVVCALVARAANRRASMRCMRPSRSA